MRPPVSVIASAILTLLASALSVLFAFMLLAIRGEMGVEVPAGRAMAVVIASFFGAGGVLGIATAVDLLRLRHWARISLLVFAGMIVTFGVFSILIFLVLPWDRMMAEVPGATRDIRPILIGIYMVPIVIGTWWLVLYTRPAMRERFAANPPADPSALPLPIAVISWITIIGGMMSAVLPFFKVPFFLVGVLITGWLTVPVFATLSVAQVYAGWGMLRKQERARRVAIAVYGLTVVQMLVMLFVPGVRERVQEASEALVPMADSPVPMDATGIWWGTNGVSLAAVVVMLWFLVRWRPGPVGRAVRE